MMPILALSSFVDALQSVLSGTARGCGWQKIGALINLGSYYVVGIPLAVIFAFVLSIGGKGLWLGIICALVVQVICLLIITLRTDWEEEFCDAFFSKFLSYYHQAKKATDRVYHSRIPENILS
ncbi:Protein DETOXIFICATION 16, partial [Mucuna pruriens]